MKTLTISLIIVLAAGAASAQHLTPAQKDSDFRYLASLYETYYAPYEWKKQLLGFDVLNTKPWLERVAATTTDLDFYEICVEYVASLNDTHDRFTIPSDFVARLPISVDIYDGKVLIETINRTLLPLAANPFAIGDEVVSMDGTDVEQLLKDFAKYAAYENPIATRRLAASRLVTRPQTVMPHAPDIGDSSVIVVRRQNGNLESYTMPWAKTGTPLQTGPVPSPKMQGLAARNANADAPDYMSGLDQVTYSGVGTEGSLTGLLNNGSRTPIFLAGFPSTFHAPPRGKRRRFFLFRNVPV